MKKLCIQNLFCEEAAEKRSKIWNNNSNDWSQSQSINIELIKYNKTEKKIKPNKYKKLKSSGKTVDFMNVYCFCLLT